MTGEDDHGIPHWIGVLIVCALIAVVAWMNACGRDPAYAQPVTTLGQCPPPPVVSQVGSGAPTPTDLLTMTGIVTPAGTGEDGYFAIGQDDTWLTKSARFALWLTGHSGQRIRITVEEVR